MSANRFLRRVKSILRVDKQTLLERDRLDAEIRLESRHAYFRKKLPEWQSETWLENKTSSEVRLRLDSLKHLLQNDDEDQMAQARRT